MLEKFMVTLTIVFVIGNNSAYATADDLTVSVGIVSWYNWYVPISRIEGMDVPKSSSAFMNGPTIKAQYKGMYLGVTYLLSSNDYELVSTTIPYGIYQTKVTSSASRTDVDFVIGYMLTPQVDLNVGYNGIFVKDTLTLATIRETYHAKHDETYNLGALGAGLHIPVGMKTMLLLNGNALLGTFDNNISYPGRVELINDADMHSTAWGVSADTSITYRIIDTLSASIGLRYHFIKAGSDHSNFFGPTLGFDYRF